MSSVWFVYLKTESGDEYYRFWKRKPSNKTIAKKMYVYLGYKNQKEFEDQLNEGVHFVSIEKKEIY